MIRKLKNRKRNLKILKKVRLMKTIKKILKILSRSVKVKSQIRSIIINQFLNKLIKCNLKMHLKHLM
jgi:uncharacterized protein Yka (UPF0111/DUF47 family)